ncbi:MAG TPA: FAD-binding oxidoreductase [Clostridia bacterium]|jgi:alkyldihydroxyacetonephosphate synthase|nr:FAD-binding oxidoreductase [Clostridia bacterium]
MTKVKPLKPWLPKPQNEVPLKEYKGYQPPWIVETPEKSYRSLFKWGHPDAAKAPRESLYKMIKKSFGMTDEDFKTPIFAGLEKVEVDSPITLTKEQIKKFEDVVGKEFVSQDPFTRASVAYGKTMLDILRLRNKIIENVPDLVIYPDTTEHIEKIVAICKEDKIPIYVYGGGSSVTRGVEPMRKGAITLDMRKRFNKVIEFNETNHSITVQAGMMGPDLEHVLNNAPELYGAKRRYTCGHFPQSFEYSSVGGWVVTRGAGQNSTYYGKIEHIVLGQEYVTPIGNIKTDTYPAKATGPDINQIMIGGEGAFGILTNVTLKIFRAMPENHYKFSFIFKDFESGVAAAKEIMQAEFGFPSVFRLSDPEESNIMLQMYGIDHDTPADKILRALGYEENKRCIFLGFTDGEKNFCKNMHKQVKKICKKHGGFYLTKYVTQGWEHGRFSDPYMRDNLQDFGVMIETMECSVNWDNMLEVHQFVRKYCKSRPNTFCMTHLSHAYPQGANLYFIFIAKMTDIDEFVSYHRGILDHIQASGAAMSHHHGIGKLFAPWLEGQIGSNQLDIFKALKNHFDPDNIMNPGGTLGLDLPESEKVFKRPKW